MENRVNPPHNVRVVHNLSAFFTEALSPQKNSILLPRILNLNFNGLAKKMESLVGHIILAEGLQKLIKQQDFKDYKPQLQTICKDMVIIQERQGDIPQLMVADRRLCQNHNPDILSLHTSHGHNPNGRVMITYNQSASTIQYADPNDVIRTYDKTGSPSYSLKENAPLHQMQTGNFWRFATEDTKKEILPLHHQYPLPKEDSPPMLQVI